MKPSMANSSHPSPSGMAAQSSPTGTAAPCRPRRSATAPISALAARPALSRAARARASKAAVSISGRLPERDKAHLRRAAGRIGGEVRAHLQMRPAVQVDLVERLPMHLAEKRTVLRLDMRQKGPAAHRMGGGDREANERRADRADAAVVGIDREPRAPPEARRLLV